ncbi:MAG TPA: nitronate monooxygenase [Candidatus Dormibacteraeota bacterium]|nr:nitronate monooxygenase [Candidatus Dormibacteraeota bacterium]
MPIATEICRLLEIEVPILNGAMTPQAGGALARAVGDAGGFGMLGFAEGESTASIREQVGIVAAGGNGRFGVGLVEWMVRRRPELFELAIEAQPRLVCISFGDPQPYVDRLHSRGILVAAQVQSRALAQRAIDAGVDVLVAQGTEAGGHTGAVGTLPLLQIVLDMTDRPVLAAGGIVSGRGLAAVIAAGAAGAWIGTPFLMATESRTNPAAQALIAASDETQTLRTSVYDRLQHTGWTPEFSGRALRNPFVERWDQHEDALLSDAAAVQDFERAKQAGDFSVAHVYAGQSVGQLEGVRPAGEIVRTIEREAIERLRRIPPMLG